MKPWLTSRNTCLLLLISACILIVLLVGCEESEDGKEESMPQISNMNSTSPAISVAFAGEPKLKSSNTLRIQVAHIPKQCILAVTIAPDVDIVSSKPTPPESYRELSGFPLARKVEPPDETLEIHYPAFVFDKDSYLPPGDSRNITGWIINAYLVDELLAIPIKGPRHVGNTHVITTSEVSKGWHLLSSEIDSETFSGDMALNLLVIPGSDAGAFFYVKEMASIASIRKEFNADFLER